MFVMEIEIYHTTLIGCAVYRQSDPYCLAYYRNPSDGYTKKQYIEIPLIENGMPGGRVEHDNVIIGSVESIARAKTIGLIMVPVIYRGPWDYEKIKNLYAPVYHGDECEGFVVRTTHGFHHNDFQKYVAKYVRRGHVQPDEGHWMTKQVVPNKLRNP